MTLLGWAGVWLGVWTTIGLLRFLCSVPEDKAVRTSVIATLLTLSAWMIVEGMKQ